MPETQLPGTPPESSEEGGSVGRDVRLLVGSVAMLGDLLMIGLIHVRDKVPYTVSEVMLHIAVLVMGALMINGKRTIELVGLLKDKIPFVGGSK